MVSQLYSPRMGHDWALGCAHWISGIPVEPLITTDLDKASCRNGCAKGAQRAGEDGGFRWRWCGFLLICGCIMDKSG